MSQKNFVGFPCISAETEDQVTRPMALHELPRQARIDREMLVISTHHERISKAIGVFWGHKDCAEYLQKLILNGGDGFGNARIGFRREVMAALINLLSLHEEEHG
jgi:hypothetical protein